MPTTVGLSCSTGSGGRDGRGVAAGIAACRGHRGARRVADGHRRDGGRFFSASEGVRRFAATSPAEPAGSGVLGDAGIVVLRLAACGFSSTSGRSAISVSRRTGMPTRSRSRSPMGANEIVVDPGHRQLSRSGRAAAGFAALLAHATVSVDDLDQSEQGGAFLWLQHGNARLLRVGRRTPSSPSRSTTAISGFADPVSHRRAVARIGERALLVVDRLEGAADHTAVQTWPLHPACDSQQRRSEASSRRRRTTIASSGSRWRSRPGLRSPRSGGFVVEAPRERGSRPRGAAQVASFGGCHSSRGADRDRGADEAASYACGSRRSVRSSSLVTLGWTATSARSR